MMVHHHDRRYDGMNSTTRTKRKSIITTALLPLLLMLLITLLPPTSSAFVTTSSSLSLSLSHTHIYFTTTNRIHPQQLLQATTTTTTTSTTDFPPLQTEKTLKQKTIKQLKEYIKEQNYTEKGLSSKLKLKQDIVDFILKKQQQSSSSLSAPTSEQNNVDASKNVEIKKTSSSPKGLQMPRLDILSQNNDDDDDNEEEEEDTLPFSSPTNFQQDQQQQQDQQEEQEQPKIQKNKKNKLFDLVLKRYPPLQVVYDVQTSLITPSTTIPEQEEEEEEEEQKGMIVNGVNKPQAINGEEEENNNNNNTLTNSLNHLQKIQITQIQTTNKAFYDGLGENDIRQSYHPLLLRAPSSADMDIVFVGTASCTPGVTRGVSCTALRLNWKRSKATVVDEKKRKEKEGGDYNNKERIKRKVVVEEYSAFNGGTWLFDCGESTQLQIQRTGSVKPGKISKIFVTHAHGDHSFGLPGLLCLIGQDRPRDAPPIDIYGPEGLRMWLRVAMRYSVSRICPAYRVHEIMDVPMAPEWDLGRFKGGRYYYQLHKEGKRGEPWGIKGLAGEDAHSWISRAPLIKLDPSSRFGEVEGGRDIFPLYDHPSCVDGAPIWEIEDEGDVRVFAAPMSHGVPCVGYVVEEQNRPGRLRNELVQPIVQRNLQALKQNGFKIPMKVMAVIKNLPEGDSFTFPDGTVLTQNEAVEPERIGRKVVICGDTADARAIAGLAQNADVLVHEATNTYLKGIDKDTDLETVTKDAKIHGHSTPQMAGDFAAKVGAKKLILNHFSARYKGDQSLDSISIMTRMEQLAMKASNLDEDCVGASWDFMILPIPQN